jgi:translin
MEMLNTLGEEIRAALEAKNHAREEALQHSRSIIRHAALAIRAVHRNERPLALEHIHQARSEAATLRETLAPYPDLYFAGYSQDALKELAEASIVYALVGGERLPSPDELQVDAAPYLNGLGEAAGELRRHCLDIMRSGRSREAERLLAMMDDIYSLLVTLDYPDAITGNLRRTTDMVRGVTERTRGDLTLSLRLEATRLAAAELEERMRKP